MEDATSNAVSAQHAGINRRSVVPLYGIKNGNGSSPRKHLQRTFTRHRGHDTAAVSDEMPTSPNNGIPPGKSSLIVIDVDGIGGGKRMALILGDWTKTWRYATEEGCDLGWQHPGVARKRVRLLPVIDVTDNGRYDAEEGGI